MILKDFSNDWKVLNQDICSLKKKKKTWEGLVKCDIPSRIFVFR